MMTFKLHRGTQEIGGSCVEVWTDSTRIIIDIGMPLVNSDGSSFNFKEYEKLDSQDLIAQGVLPDVKGFYIDEKPAIDGVLISHAHQDHFGFAKFVNPKIPFYLSQATAKILELNNLFLPAKLNIAKKICFEKEKSFKIGDISIKAYLMDHSAFDSYAFLIEANGKRLFYSGDFRGHGRKAGVFKWFRQNEIEGVDYLLLEGTALGRSHGRFKTEVEIENELVELFKQSNKINLIMTSGQNIDRLVSIFKACQRTGKILVVDPYIGTVLKELSKFARLPFPSKDYKRIKVLFTNYISDKLKREGNDTVRSSLEAREISKGEIGNSPSDFVMIVRSSLKTDLNHIIEKIKGGNLIYSLWTGYLKQGRSKKFVEYLQGYGFKRHDIHTSGHADIPTLQEMVKVLNPKFIVPIHTFKGSEYAAIFDTLIVELADGEVCRIG